MLIGNCLHQVPIKYFKERHKFELWIGIYKIFLRIQVSINLHSLLWSSKWAFFFFKFLVIQHMQATNHCSVGAQNHQTSLICGSYCCCKKSVRISNRGWTYAHISSKQNVDTQNSKISFMWLSYMCASALCLCTYLAVQSSLKWSLCQCLKGIQHHAVITRKCHTVRSLTDSIGYK